LLDREFIKASSETEALAYIHFISNHIIFLSPFILEHPEREYPRSQVSGYSFRLPYLGDTNLMKH